MRNLALDHVAERIDDSAYLERRGHLRVDLAALDAIPRGDLPARRAVGWLRVLAETWANADAPEVRADLLHAISERIVVVGRSIVAARLTPAAYSNGLALALPQVVMARPEGFGRARTTSVHREPVPSQRDVRRPSFRRVLTELAARSEPARESAPVHSGAQGAHSRPPGGRHGSPGGSYQRGVASRPPRPSRSASKTDRPAGLRTSRNG
jgi:hypothetical protein